MPLRYRKEQYPFVIPDLQEWPIAQLTRHKAAFIDALVPFAKERILAAHDGRYDAVIERAMYLERKRMKEEPWRIDPASEKKYWKKVRKQLIQQPQQLQGEALTAWYDALLEQMIRRYAREIAGHFDINTYWFARRFLTTAFTRLLNAASAKDVFRIWDMRIRLQERILTVGEVEHVRDLVDKGTIVLVPTHFSNLDSILIGLTLDFVGLPAFSYGAGLNLFNSGAVAYFMNRLGAYRVDRRKKSDIYLETLKGYSNLSIEQGVHSLFFPGGTRSRSGEIETALKMGLLGTAVDAQRRLYASGSDRKVFVVPLVLSYHFVLEAQSLIDQHLKRTGKEQYYVKDEFQSSWKLLQFIWRFFQKSSEIIVSFGRPLDVLGNFVNEAGESVDQHGNVIDTQDYFKHGGVVTTDFQRQAEYTKILADRIVERYHAENIVLSSHVVAYTAFKLLEHQHPDKDIYDLLRIPSGQVQWSLALFRNAVAAVQQVLVRLEREQRLKLSPDVAADLTALLQSGLSNIGIYHDRQPLRWIKQQQYIATSDLKLLLYYHNHLMGYDIEHQVHWASLLEAHEVRTET